MGLLQDNGLFELSPHDSPLSKRRRFAPQELPPVIPMFDNRDIENHTFDSPLILQLCEQAPLPEQIQADLLKVGMRVRKAVPEGYRTRRFTPRPFFNMGRLSPETQAAVSGSPKQQAAELSPFSAGGLHNVGGLAMQPIATATFCGISLSALSDYEGIDHEQKMWTYSTSHKRGLQLDEDSEDWSPQTPTLQAELGFGMPVDYFTIDMENAAEFSPLSQFPRHRRQNSIPLQQTSLPELNALDGSNGRRMVKPKTRVRGPVIPPPPTNFNPFANIAVIPEEAQPVFSPPPPVSSHHTRVLSCGMEANLSFHDFGEASFLQRRDDVDMDCS